MVGGVSLGSFTLATGNTGPNTDSGSWSGQALTISGAVSGTGGVTQDGAGTLILSNANNNYSGGTTVEEGTLELAATGAAGTNAITFSPSTELIVANGVSVGNTLNNLSAGDKIDLAGLTFSANVSATVFGSTLRVSDGSTTDTFTLNNFAAAGFLLSKDSAGGGTC